MSRKANAEEARVNNTKIARHLWASAPNPIYISSSGKQSRDEIFGGMTNQPKENHVSLRKTCRETSKTIMLYVHASPDRDGWPNKGFVALLEKGPSYDYIPGSLELLFFGRVTALLLNLRMRMRAGRTGANTLGRTRAKVGLGCGNDCGCTSETKG